MIKVRNKELSEIIDEACLFTTQKAQAEFLRKNQSAEMKKYVELFYGVDFSEFKIPPYSKNTKPIELCYLNMARALKQLTVAIQFHSSNDTRRYENKMIIILEDLPESESDLIVDMIQQRERIIEKVWKKVFPEFFRTGLSDQEDEEENDQ